jgi:fructosamine-3-kinase
MWNTAYLVVPCGGHFEELIFRVASPAITRLSKVAAEVATMRWVEDNTVIPVPHVVAYGDDRTNEVGYEWYVLSLLPFSPVDEC